MYYILTLIFSPLSVNPRKWSNIVKQFIKLFDLFVGLTLKRLIKLSVNWDYVTKPDGIRAIFWTLWDIYDGTLLAVFAKFSISDVCMSSEYGSDYTNFKKNIICNIRNLFRSCLHSICKNKGGAWMIRIKRWLVFSHYEMLAH